MKNMQRNNADTEMGNMDMSNMDMGNMDMRMSYYFGHDNVQMFFEKWKVDSHRDMVIACLIIALMTCIGECIRLWKEHQIGKC